MLRRMIKKSILYFMPTEKVKRRLKWFQKNRSSFRNMCGGVIATFFRDYFAVKYGIEIGCNANIKSPIDFPHPRNIVIGDNVSIGGGCKIWNDVTIGAKSSWELSYPEIGDGVYIYPGARIIGGIKVGNGAIIGTNSVVLHDVQEQEIVAGNPAIVIGQRKMESENI